MNVIVVPQARIELDAAVDYYESKCRHLGSDFLDDYLAQVNLIKRFPEIAPAHEEFDDVHHLPLRKFPYSILYAIEIDIIYVLAVASQHRGPEYWSSLISRTA